MGGRHRRRNRSVALPLATVIAGLGMTGTGVAALADDRGVPARGGAGPSTTPVPGPSGAASPVLPGVVPGGSPRPAGPATTPSPVDALAAAARPPLRDVPPVPGEPVRVLVPGAGVTAPVDPVGVDDARRLEVPEDPAQVGWWSGGAVPGRPGPAVLVGHVDSVDGPGAFYGVGGLDRGDEVLVEDGAGTTSRFVVTRVEQVGKDAFPTDRVYGRVDGSELRLVTCGGDFDEATGHYEDNVIVYARATGRGD